MDMSYRWSWTSGSLKTRRVTSDEATPVYDNDFGRRIDSYYGPDA